MPDNDARTCADCRETANCMDCPLMATMQSLRDGERMRQDDLETEARARVDDYAYGCTWDPFTGVLYGQRDEA